MASILYCVPAGFFPAFQLLCQAQPTPSLARVLQRKGSAVHSQKPPDFPVFTHSPRVILSLLVASLPSGHWGFEIGIPSQTCLQLHASFSNCLPKELLSSCTRPACLPPCLPSVSVSLPFALSAKWRSKCFIFRSLPFTFPCSSANLDPSILSYKLEVWL